MPELTHKERLQPSLLDRLTDDLPDERQESRDRRVLSAERLRACVLRDLTWLLNTTNLSALVDLSAYPEASKSVINYGLPDLAGHTVSSIDVPRLEQLLRHAIVQFEPRLLPRTLRIRLVVDRSEMSHNSMRFSIEAELWSQPMPLQLYMRTEIDLEDGDIRVAEERDPTRRGGASSPRRSGRADPQQGA